MEALLTRERAGRVAGDEGSRAMATDRTRREGGPEEREIFDQALSGVRERVSIYAPPFRRQVLEAAMAEMEAMESQAGELIGMESRVREILARLPVKARAAFETLLRVNVLGDLEEGIDWGGAIVNEAWKGLEALQQARRELPDDPDVQVLERVCRLAGAIDGGDFPAIEQSSVGPAAAETVGGMDTMEAVDALNAMEPEIRALVAGLDVRTRAIVGMLARLFTIESDVGGCEWTAALYNELMADEAAIEQACRELPDDPVVQLLCRAHGLVRRLEGSEDSGATATDRGVTQGARELIGVFGGRYLPEVLDEMIEKLQKAGDKIVDLETPEGEAAAMAAVKPIRESVPFHDIEAKDILDVFRKHAPEDRAAVLSAAAASARALARTASQLGQTEARFAAAIASLDPRTKAILRVVRDVSWVDGNINSRFCDEWREVVRESPVDALRSDPANAELLRIHEMAALLLETMG